MTRRSVKFLGAVLMFAIAALAIAPSAARGAAPPAPATGERVNINTAGVDELVTLPGIGKAYAERIVEYRQKNGPFKKVEDIKPLFQNLMGDLVQTSKRPDISSGDAECIKSTIRELLQISDELSSYEYLITIEKEMTDFGDNNPMRGIVKFAVEKSNTILVSERKRLAQLSDQCTRFPLSFGKTQQALQFIDITTGILDSIRVRL